MGCVELLRGLLVGDQRSLAKAISLVEEGGEEARRLLKGIRASKSSFIIGITGPPGTGKSTLLAKLIAGYRARGLKVGVLAIDPSSRISGGAFLGDRVRMLEHGLDDGVFIRSMATRGSKGGLARATRDALRLLEASGKERILLETAGTGQADVEVKGLVDCVLLVLMPELGDEVQALKAGILEVGDVIAINKADLPGSSRMLAQIREAVKGRGVQVMAVSAREGKGIRELLEVLERFREEIEARGEVELRRRRWLEEQLEEELMEAFKSLVLPRLKARPEFEALLKGEGPSPEEIIQRVVKL